MPGYFIAYGQISVDFSASVTSGCTPVNVQFTDLSTGNPTIWFWDFGNGTTSNEKNPVATFTTQGNYSIRLIAKNSSGQNFTIKNNYITVSATPDAQFSLSEISGCLPLQVNFQNNTNLFGEGIKSSLWDFGDGSTSNLQNPSHTYNMRGVFNVTLTAQNVQGCLDSRTVTSAVKTGNKPTGILFKAAPLDGCASALRKFTGSATGNITTWEWNFGDGGTDNTKNLSYHYTDTGWFSVKLTVSDNGCADSVQYNRYVHVIGPIAKYFRTVHCTDPYSVVFHSQTNGAQSWNWEFGDGVTSTVRDPFHKYTTTGMYTIKLNVSGGACTDSTSDTIYVVDQNPSYKVVPAKNSFCKNDSITFIVYNYDSSVIRGFAWSFDNGITRTRYILSNSLIKTAYPQSGTYPSPLLYSFDKESCFDTVSTTPLIITGPTASFNNSAPLCIGNAVNFTDKSVPYNNSPLTQWQWNFGDGDSVLSASSSVNYIYPFLGLYNVLLKITDTDGCSDTISHQVNISDTPVVSAGSDTSICSGKSVTLQATGGTTYTWSINPYLSCTDCVNPVASPIDTTTFYVTGKNAAGCAALDSVKINVQQQEKITARPVTDTICAGDSIQLFASGTDFYRWQPAISLNNPGISNPIATPVSNTIYTVTGTDKAQCFSNTASVTIVANPKPLVNITDSAVTIQPGATYQINTVNSPDVIKWHWQPAIWLSDANIANPVAQPQETTTYNVIGETAGGCISRDQITIMTICNSSVLFVPNTFSPNNDGMNDYFFPRSGSIVKIKSLKIFNKWGQEIFKTNNFSSNDQSAGWDGKYKGISQQADVYIYFMQVTCSNGSTFSKQGSITLLR